MPHSRCRARPLNSQLSSVPACQSIIKKAVVKRLMQFHHTSVLPETGAEYKIRFMLRKNVCEIMLDTTGEGLHKRGYRRNAMEAPIRETLAATIAAQLYRGGCPWPAWSRAA